MIKIAIIEDIPVFQRELRDAINRAFENNELPEVDCFKDGEQFLSNSYNGNPYSAIFIDIELPGINGMDIAKTIRANGFTAMIVFTTSHEQYVYEGYEAEAFRYLLKPVTDSDIKICVARIIQDAGNRALVFSFNRKQYYIDFNEIIYISSYGHYITIHTENAEYEWKHSLKELAPELPEQFVRCHRSFIINLDHLRTIEGKRVFMKNGTEIDVAGGYLDDVRKALSQLA